MAFGLTHCVGRKLPICLNLPLKAVAWVQIPSGLTSAEMVREARSRTRAESAGTTSRIVSKSAAQTLTSAPTVDGTAESGLPTTDRIGRPASRSRSWPLLAVVAAVGVFVAVAIAAVAALNSSPDGGAAKAAYDTGSSMVDGEQWEEAVTAFNEVIALEPEDGELLAVTYLDRSYALLQLGQMDGVVADATMVITLEPDDLLVLVTAYVNRWWGSAWIGRPGVTALQREARESARDDANTAFDLSEGDAYLTALALQARSVAHSYLGDFSEAVTDALAAETLQPSFSYEVSYALLDWTIPLEETRQHEMGVNAARAAIEIGFPNDDDAMIAHLNLGSALDLAGHPQESIEASTTAIDMGHPDPASLALAHLNRAGAFAKLGRHDEALVDSIVGRDLTAEADSAWGRTVHRWALGQVADWERALAAGR